MNIYICHSLMCFINLERTANICYNLIVKSERIGLKWIFFTISQKADLGKFSLLFDGMSVINIHLNP